MDDIARIEIACAVARNKLIVCTTSQDLSGQPALESTANDLNHSPLTLGSLADNLRRRDGYSRPADQFETRFRWFHCFLADHTRTITAMTKMIFSLFALLGGLGQVPGGAKPLIDNNR